MPCGQYAPFCQLAIRRLFQERSSLPDSYKLLCRVALPARVVRRCLYVGLQRCWYAVNEIRPEASKLTAHG